MSPRTLHLVALSVLISPGPISAGGPIPCGTSGGGTLPATQNGVGTSCEEAIANAIHNAIGNPCNWCDVWTQCERESVELTLDPEWDFSCGTRPKFPGVYFAQVSFGTSTFVALCGACPAW